MHIPTHVRKACRRARVSATNVPTRTKLVCQSLKYQQRHCLKYPQVHYHRGAAHVRDVHHAHRNVRCTRMQACTPVHHAHRNVRCARMQPGVHTSAGVCVRCASRSAAALLRRCTGTCLPQGAADVCVYVCVCVCMCLVQPLAKSTCEM